MPFLSAVSDKALSTALKESCREEDPQDAAREALGKQSPPLAEAASRLKYLKRETEHVFVLLHLGQCEGLHG